MTKFEERISALSDQELLSVIRAKDDYQEQFWQLSVAEARARNFGNQLDTILKSIEEAELMKVMENSSNHIELFSFTAIVVFSLIFTPIAGSILAANNLKRINVKGGNKLIWIGILTTIIIGGIIRYVPFSNLRFAGIVLGVFAGIVISVKTINYYPEALQYKKRKIWKALLVSIITLLALYILVVVLFSI